MPWLDQMTNTSGGIWYASDVMFTPEHGDRGNVMNVMVVITDGESNRDPQFVAPNADNARAKGIEVFVLGRIL